MSLFYAISFLSMIVSITCSCDTDAGLPETEDDYNRRKGQGFVGDRIEIQSVCYATAEEGGIEKDDDVINQIVTGEWMKVREMDYDIYVVNCGFSDSNNQYVGQGDIENSLLTYTCTRRCKPCRRINNINFNNLRSYHPSNQNQGEENVQQEAVCTTCHKPV